MSTRVHVLTGKDADEMFEDIGHSNEARKTMDKYRVGDLKVGGTRDNVCRTTCATSDNAERLIDKQHNAAGMDFMWSFVSRGWLSPVHVEKKCCSRQQTAAVVGKELVNCEFISMCSWGVFCYSSLRIMGVYLVSFIEYTDSTHQPHQSTSVSDSHLPASLLSFPVHPPLYPFILDQVDPNAPKKASKRGNASDIKSKGGLNPIALVVLLIAIAAGVYFSQMKR